MFLEDTIVVNLGNDSESAVDSSSSDHNNGDNI